MEFWSKWRSKQRTVNHNLTVNHPGLNSESLEERVLLSASFQYDLSLDFTEGSNLIYNFVEPVPAEYQLDVLQQHLQLEPHESMELIQSRDDLLGYTHFRYQQHAHGIPVEGGVYTLHVIGDEIVSVSGDYFDAENLNATPELSSLQALDRAIHYIGADFYLWQDPELQAALEQHDGHLHDHDHDHDHGGTFHHLGTWRR